MVPNYSSACWNSFTASQKEMFTLADVNVANFDLVLVII